MKKRSKHNNKKKAVAPKAPAKAEAKKPAPMADAPTAKPPAARTAETVPAPVAIRREPTLDEIRARAYQRFLNRGGAPGRMIEDWLAAERDLKAERN